MESSPALRCGPTFAFVLAGVMGAFGLAIAQPPTSTAQSPTKGPIDGFTATAANVTGAGDPVKIDLLRWSTDTERDQFFSAMSEKGEKELLIALQKAPPVGYVWTSESAGYAIRYAYRIAAPGGAERIVLATDHPLGSWNPQIWRATETAKGKNYQFAVIELRVTKGTGEGKSSLFASVTVDKEARTIALENYAASPVVLKGVKREPRGAN